MCSHIILINKIIECIIVVGEMVKYLFSILHKYKIIQNFVIIYCTVLVYMYRFFYTCKYLLKLLLIQILMFVIFCCGNLVI